MIIHKYTMFTRESDQRGQATIDELNIITKKIIMNWLIYQKSIIFFNQYLAWNRLLKLSVTEYPRKDKTTII